MKKVTQKQVEQIAERVAELLIVKYDYDKIPAYDGEIAIQLITPCPNQPMSGGVMHLRTIHSSHPEQDGYADFMVKTLRDGISSLIQHIANEVLGEQDGKQKMD
jgi:hypothetical protein